MSKVLITRSKLDELATTIAAKSGATLPLTIAQMDAAVDGIITRNDPFDFLGAERVYSEVFSEEGEGMAIMNRLNKAAGYCVIDLDK